MYFFLYLFISGTSAYYPFLEARIRFLRAFDVNYFVVDVFAFIDKELESVSRGFLFVKKKKNQTKNKSGRNLKSGSKKQKTM